MRTVELDRKTIRGLWPNILAVAPTPPCRVLISENQFYGERGKKSPGSNLITTCRTTGLIQPLKLILRVDPLVWNENWRGRESPRRFGEGLCIEQMRWPPLPPPNTRVFALAHLAGGNEKIKCFLMGRSAEPVVPKAQSIGCLMINNAIFIHQVS